MLVTALNRHIGYDKAAAIAKHAQKKGLDAARGGARVRRRDGGAVRAVDRAGGDDAAQQGLTYNPRHSVPRTGYRVSGTGYRVRAFHESDC